MAGAGNEFQVGWGARAARAILGALALMLALSTSAHATVLPTTITGNMTLTPAGSPYTGSSTIEAGAVVDVQPGTVFNISSLVVKGTLKAEGTAEAPVAFIKGSSPGSWQNIKFEPGSGASVIDHVEVRYGASSTSTGAIEINGSSPRITHTAVRDSKNIGIRILNGGSPEIAYNEVKSSGSTGVYVESPSGEINIHDNLVRDSLNNGMRVTASGTSFSRSLGGNTFISNNGAAINYSGPDIPPDIATNALSENKYEQIVIGGTISQSSTWADPGYSFFMEGEVTIASGATWTIKPGVIFDANRTTVKGTLKAEGTAEAPVVFSRGTTAGSWRNIKFEAGSGASILDHVEVSYGGASTNTAGIEITGASPTITHSVIRNSKYSGIRILEGGSPEIAYNEVKSNNGAGIVYEGHASGDVNVHNNVVQANLGMGINVNASGASFSRALGGNTLVSNGGSPLNYSGPDIPPDITTNTFKENTYEEILVSGTISHSSTWGPAGVPVRFGSTVVLASGVTLNLDPGSYIRSPKMTVFGTLKSEGTATRPVTLTGPNEEKGGEWTGINLQAGSGASVINYTEVAYGGSGGPMLNVKGVSPTITNSTFRRSSGDAIRVQQSGQPIIEKNRFRNNQFGLRYEGEGSLSAPRNDWGCTNGPKPTGCGDSVTSNVSWQPAVVLQELPRLCPGTTLLASSNTCLLQKYEPELRLDSEENYLADNAAEITDNWGDEEGFQHEGALGGYTNVLLDGTMPISESAPWGFYSMFPLSLDVLGANYPAAYGGAAADGDDWIDESNEYVRDAHLMEEAGYSEAAYGRAITDGSGKRWLEYWYWYYYNPKSFAINTGVHEGDWESVLVGLDANNRPEEVIFSQHTQPSNCYIGDVETAEEGGPIIYVAVDSHANYPKPGSFDAGFVTDYADGAGASLQPGLTIIDNSPPSWISWPGHWGGSRGEFDSPTGPAFHSAWSDPAGYAAGAAECSQTEIEEWEGAPEMQAYSSTASLSSVSFNGRQPQVGYRVEGADGEGYWPRLRISVDELGDGGIPPVSKMISDVKAKGQMTLPVRLEHGHAAEVLGSIVYKDGRRVRLTPRKVQSP